MTSQAISLLKIIKMELPLPLQSCHCGVLGSTPLAQELCGELHTLCESCDCPPCGPCELVLLFDDGLCLQATDATATGGLLLDCVTERHQPIYSAAREGFKRVRVVSLPGLKI